MRSVLSTHDQVLGLMLNAVYRMKMIVLCIVVDCALSVIYTRVIFIYFS